LKINGVFSKSLLLLITDGRIIRCRWTKVKGSVSKKEGGKRTLSKKEQYNK